MKPKKCKACGNEFNPYTSRHIVCTYECFIQHTKNLKAKKQAQQNRREKKEYYDNDRKHQIGLTVKACNDYIKERDKNLPCISCGATKNTIQYAAGHYKPAGNNPQLRFNELNIHKQCNRDCNMAKSGNLIHYRQGLIEKIGLSKVEWIESYQGDYKYTIEDLKEIREYYKDKIKELKE